MVLFMSEIKEKVATPATFMLLPNLAASCMEYRNVAENSRYDSNH